MNYYILHTFLLVTVLLFIIAISCCHYAKQKPKQKKYWHTNNIKIEKNSELKKLVLKIVCVVILMT